MQATSTAFTDPINKANLERQAQQLVLSIQQQPATNMQEFAKALLETPETIGNCAFTALVFSKLGIVEPELIERLLAKATETIPYNDNNCDRAHAYWALKQLASSAPLDLSGIAKTIVGIRSLHAVLTLEKDFIELNVLDDNLTAALAGRVSDMVDIHFQSLCDLRPAVSEDAIRTFASIPATWAKLVNYALDNVRDMSSDKRIATMEEIAKSWQPNAWPTTETCGKHRLDYVATETVKFVKENPNLSATELISLTRSCATICCFNTELIELLSERLASKAKTMQPSEVCETLGAFAKMRHSVSQVVFRTIGVEASSFWNGQYANAFDALCRGALLKEIAMRTTQLINDMSGEQVVDILNALSYLGDSLDMRDMNLPWPENILPKGDQSARAVLERFSELIPTLTANEAESAKMLFAPIHNGLSVSLAVHQMLNALMGRLPVLTHTGQSVPSPYEALQLILNQLSEGLRGSDGYPESDTDEPHPILEVQETLENIRKALNTPS